MDLALRDSVAQQSPRSNAASDRAARLALAEAIDRTLSRSGHASIRFLQVDICDGEVTVSGGVTSYYEKQMALEELRHVPGVSQLRDRMEVMRA